MRERTTWNRQEIASASSQGRTAEDPRAMNQDHLSQQPAADAYVTGGPSEFAEDVHPPEGTWKAEESGGETKRNEIGMPEFRGDTFKNAGLDEETLNKKAEVCIKVAREMLPTAAEAVVEDQAYALMHLPDVELVETHARLAKGKVPPEFLEQQQKMKDKAKDGDDKGDDAKADKDSDKEASDADKEAAQKKQQQDQQQDADPEGGEQQDSGEQKKMDEADEEDATQQQQKQAFSLAEQVVQSIQAGDQQGAQQQIQEMVQQASASGTASAAIGQQVQQMIQQAMQQQQKQSVPPGIAGCGTESKVMSDDQMLDQMLQDEMAQGDQEMVQGEPMDIQLEGAPMDIGEVQLGPEDAVLGQLFASNQEVLEAQQAESLRTGIPVQAQQEAPVTAAGTTRTASTRTVGTRPTGGVSQLGGAAAPDAPSQGGGEIDKLSSMWKSAPDMSGVFNGE